MKQPAGTAQFVDEASPKHSAARELLITTAIALISLWSLNETFYKDLNYSRKEEGVPAANERAFTV